MEPKSTADGSQVSTLAPEMPGAPDLVVARPLASPIEQILDSKIAGLVARYVAEFGRTEDDALRCYDAWLQFMVVTAMMPGTKIPSPQIDDMWHTALMFTADYRALCESLGRFIDHEPVVEPDPDGYLQYMETREYARGVFGSLDGDMWPTAIEVAKCGGCGSRSRS